MYKPQYYVTTDYNSHNHDVDVRVTFLDSDESMMLFGKLILKSLNVEKLKMREIRWAGQDICDVKAAVETALHNKIEEYISNGLIDKYLGEWKFYALKAAMLEIGLHYYNYSDTDDTHVFTAITDKQKDILLLYLLKQNGELIDDLRRAPVRLALDFQKIIQRKEFDNAIEVSLKDDYILALAGVPKEG
jgi:hypothetical protein